MPRVVPIHAALLMLGATGCRQTTCSGGETQCYEVDRGRYLALEPEQTNEDGSMGLLVYFHGWNSSAENYAQKDWLSSGASKRGYLLVLPDGMENTWAHEGSPSDARDELKFMDAVLQDVTTRWDISPVRAVAGFSQGASMAWDLACYRGDDYSAFIPASGAFWEPLPDGCETPINLRHTHGTSDTVIPLQGRSIGDAQQGDVHLGMSILRQANECAEEPDKTVSEGDCSCDVWDSCASGNELRLCLHDGKHRLPNGYLDDALIWVEEVSPTP